MPTPFERLPTQHEKLQNKEIPNTKPENKEQKEGKTILKTTEELASLEQEINNNNGLTQLKHEIPQTTNKTKTTQQATIIDRPKNLATNIPIHKHPDRGRDVAAERIESLLA